MSAVAYTFEPIHVTIRDESYLITQAHWCFNPSQCTALGLNARLQTAEELANNPKALEYLVDLKSGGITKI